MKMTQTKISIMIDDIDNKLQSEMITLFDKISQFHLKEQAKKELANIHPAIDLRNVPKVPRYTYVTANGIDYDIIQIILSKNMRKWKILDKHYYNNAHIESLETNERNAGRADNPDRQIFLLQLDVPLSYIIAITNTTIEAIYEKPMYNNHIGIDETQYSQLLEWVKNWIEEDQNRVDDYA